MYNKLFTKILDSSIWLAPDPHRLVWITILAAMDEDGNVMFASPANVAARARVTLEQAKEAIAAFEGPDPDSGDPDHEGRRIERFPGGWHVLNAHKYRAMTTKIVVREQTRLRVAKHRQKLATSNADVTQANAEQRGANAAVTPSEADAHTDSNSFSSKEKKPRERAAPLARPPEVCEQVWNDWMTVRKAKTGPLTATAWAAVVREAKLAGITPGEAVRIAAENSWAGFKASWPRDGGRAFATAQNGPTTPSNAAEATKVAMDAWEADREAVISSEDPEKRAAVRAKLAQVTRALAGGGQ